MTMLITSGSTLNHRWYGMLLMRMHSHHLQAEKQRKLELQEKRASALRAVLAGQNFVAGEDPFEGMSPKEIQAFAEEQRNRLGVQSDDPFDGMTPEEIDAYVQKHGLNM